MIIASAYTFLKVPIFKYMGGFGTGLNLQFCGGNYYSRYYAAYDDYSLFYKGVYIQFIDNHPFDSLFSDVFNEIILGMDWVASPLLSMSDLWAMYFQKSSLRLFRTRDGKEIPLIFSCMGIGSLSPSILCHALISEDEFHYLSNPDTISYLSRYTITANYRNSISFLTAALVRGGYDFSIRPFMINNEFAINGGNISTSGYFDFYESEILRINETYRTDKLKSDYPSYASVIDFNYKYSLCGLEPSENSLLFSTDHLNFYNKYKEIINMQEMQNYA